MAAKTKGTLEDRFMEAWKEHFPGLPEPERQFPIRNPATGRDWRLDFAFPPEGLFIEIQGSGRHQRLVGQSKDYERHNYLTANGWRGLYFNAIGLRDMEEAVTTVAEVLCKSIEVEA